MTPLLFCCCSAAENACLFAWQSGGLTINPPVRYLQLSRPLSRLSSRQCPTGLSDMGRHKIYTHGVKYCLRTPHHDRDHISHQGIWTVFFKNIKYKAYRCRWRKNSYDKNRDDFCRNMKDFPNGVRKSEKLSKAPEARNIPIETRSAIIVGAISMTIWKRGIFLFSEYLKKVFMML